MFYSQSLLSKGQLRNIWVAAYFFKKLKKEQITNTDISSTIDQILPDGKFSYRILAQLLLGIVKIFSKKVEFLYQDCHATLIKIGKFSIASIPKKIVYSPTRKGRKREAICDPSSVSLVEAEIECEPSGVAITVPKRFDLDSFDLKVEEKEPTESVEEHLSKDSQTGDKEFFLIQREQTELARQDDYSAACFTPLDDVLPPELMDLDLEVDPKDHLQGYSRHLDESKSRENIGARRSLDSALLMNQEILEEHRECLLSGNSNKFPTVGASIRIEQEVSCEIPDHEKCPASEEMLPEGTTVVQGLPTPRITVTTPSKRERPRSMKKRKWSDMDEEIVLSNKLLRTWIHDSSNLVCKRRKAPAGHLDSWRTRVISKLSQSFMNSLITCMSPELEALFHSRNKTPKKSRDRIAEPGTRVRVSTPPQVVDGHTAEHPSGRIAEPETSADGSTPPHSIDGARNSNHALALTKKDDPISEDPEFLKEVGSFDNDGGWSVRTRDVARFLIDVFMNQKNCHEPISLDHILRGCTRRRCSKFFYETLTLKTIGCVDVAQNSPYGDIILSALPPLEQFLKRRSSS